MDLYYGTHEHNLSGDDIDENYGIVKCPDCGRRMRKVWIDDGYEGSDRKYIYECDYCG